jgi:hypothetical protein
VAMWLRVHVSAMSVVTCRSCMLSVPSLVRCINFMVSAAASRLLLGQSQCGSGAWWTAHRHLPYVPVSFSMSTRTLVLSARPALTVLAARCGTSCTT